MTTQMRTTTATTLDEQVTCTPYEPGSGFPLFVQPREARLRSDADAALAWFVGNRSGFEAMLIAAGALVFRGFPVNDTAAFSALFAHYECPRFGYTAGSSPRDQIAPRVYESTHAPAQDIIMLHQEMAYLPVFPARIAFYCRVPAVSGGETLIADMRRVTADLPGAFVDEVAAHGVRYGRNFRDRAASTGNAYLDIVHRTWQDAFDTTDREKPIADCRTMGLDAHWLDDGSLSTGYLSRGLVEHPATGERLWFNQISTTAMGPEAIGERFALYDGYYGTTRPRPYHTTYGNGGAIAADHLAALYATLRKHTVAFPWSAGDVLLLDNYISAHGRNRFTGLRDIQVALFS